MTARTNERDCGGDTVLHYASDSGDLELVRYLVEHGADTFFDENGFGNRPEDHAATEEVRAYLIAQREKIEFERSINIPGGLSATKNGV